MTAPATLLIADDDPVALALLAEVLAGEGFDGRRVGAEAPGFVAEPGILGPQALDRGNELLMRLARPERFGEPALADESVDNQHQGDEDEEHLQGAPARCGSDR